MASPTKSASPMKAPTATKNTSEHSKDKIKPPSKPASRTPSNKAPSERSRISKPRDSAASKPPSMVHPPDISPIIEIPEEEDVLSEPAGDYPELKGKYRTFEPMRVSTF